MLTTPATTETIGFVSDGAMDSLGVAVDQEFVDILETDGFDVVYLADTLTGSPLTTEQLDLVESFDLIIISRSTASGDYNDPFGWNSVAKPLISLNPYFSRSSRWQWFNSTDLLGGGRIAPPQFNAKKPDHPIFYGVELDENNNVDIFDSSVGSGQVTLPAVFDAGNGQILATTADSGTASIVYWPADTQFHNETDQFAAASRLLFSAGTSNDTFTGEPSGEYNLTSSGKTMFKNAVMLMLGKEILPSSPENLKLELIQEGGLPAINVCWEHPEDGGPKFYVERRLLSEPDGWEEIYDDEGELTTELCYPDVEGSLGLELGRCYCYRVYAYYDKEIPSIPTGEMCIAFSCGHWANVDCSKNSDGSYTLKPDLFDIMKVAFHLPSSGNGYNPQCDVIDGGGILGCGENGIDLFDIMAVAGEL